MNLKILHFPQNLIDDKHFFNIYNENSYYQDMFVASLYTTLNKLGHNVELQRLYEKENNNYFYKDMSARSGINGPDNNFYMDLVIIENISTGAYIVMDMRDSSGNPWSTDSNCKGIFLTHFNREDLINRYNENSYKVFPFYFCDYFPNQVLRLRNTINNLLELPKIDKFFFSGTITGITTDLPYSYNGINVREVAIELDQHYKELFYLQKTFLTLEDFLLKSSRFKVSLSLPGHPWCSREHQYLSAGIPLLTYRYKSERIFPIIPEMHYTSVEVEPRTLMGFPVNKEEGAKVLADKFLEVKDNAPLLKARALAGQVHYDNYIYPPAFAEKFAPLILPLLK
jgi:hypothetical protein